MQHNNRKESEKGLVSVVIPCYNAEAYVGQAIESVLQQNYQQFEIIVIIDGATDQSEAIVRTFADKDTRIRIFTQTNKGVSVTRNEGVARSTGEFIAFLDADDAWGKENIEKKVQLLNKQADVAWVYSDMYLADEELKITEVIEGGDDTNTLSSLLARRGDVIHAPSNLVLRRDSLVETGVIFDPMLSTSADWDFCIQLAAKNLKGRRIPEPLWLYRILEGSMSRNFEALERDNLYVHKKASKQHLFESFSFRQKCFSNNFLILAGIWWVNGDRKLKGLGYIIKSMLYYPPNFLKVVKKIRGSGLYQAKRTVVLKTEEEQKRILVTSNTSFNTRKKVAVFLMHRINVIKDPLWNPIHPRHFERILVYLKKHYEVVPLQGYLLNEYVPKTNKPLCAIGFDDGYRDFLTYALPILKKHDCPSSMYVVVDCIDKDLPPWTYILNHHFINTSKLSVTLDTRNFPVELQNTSWKKKNERLLYAKRLNSFLKSVDNETREFIYEQMISQLNDVSAPRGLMLTWEEIRELKNHNCEVGSHTYNHPVLSRELSHERLQQELKDSALAIQKHTGFFPLTISYPFGAFNQEVKVIAKEAGYKVGVTVNPIRFDSLKYDNFEIPRIELYDESLLFSIARLSQFLPKIKKVLFHTR